MREKIRETALDRAIAWLSPGRGLQRRQARLALAMTGGYVGARRDRRATQNWTPLTQSADAALLPDLPTLRDRSRDLLRNAPLARGAVATVGTNVVGTGLKLRAQIDAELLGLDDEQADAWEQAAEREFALWADSQECDLARTLTFTGFQGLSLRSRLEAGDMFVFLRWLERPGSPYGLKIQGIEGDRVSNPNNGRDTLTRAGGVEIDPETGAPIGYHVTNRHPGELLGGTVTWSVFPAFSDLGRPLVLHLFEPDRWEQRRGMPYLAPVVEALKQLDRYSEAELMAAVVNACFSVVTKVESGSGTARTPLAGTSSETPPSSDLSRADIDFEPGLVIEGFRPNESIEGFAPGRPNAQFDPFVLAVLRQVGMALELPYEVLIKHFTASYSAARAALLEAWKMFRTRRAWLARTLCQPVYEAVLTEAVARGRLKAPGFFRDAAIMKAWCGAEWVGPAAGQIDPAKEADANATMVDRGWKTDAEVTAEMTGGDFDRKIRERAREEDRKRALGLKQPPPMIAVGQQPQGAAPAPPEPDPQNPDRPEEADAA